ncbi:MAG TPA: class I SAM-dependent methyltransferase [Longimicrobium sp.]
MYEAIEAAGGPEVPYHAHTTARIAAFLREVVSATAASRVLDAGCGGLEYLQGPHRWVGIDLVHATLVARAGTAVAGDIHSLPFADGSFDHVICVGSVANYLDLPRAARELARVLAPGGRLVLEYERSRSWLTFGTRHFGRDDVPWAVEYKEIRHEIRLYSDRFVDAALRSAGLARRARRCFHHLPPFAHHVRVGAFLAARLPPGPRRSRGRCAGLPAGNAIALYGRDGGAAGP